MQPQDNMNQIPNGEVDREGAMAKADLYKLANYSLKLFKRMHDEDQLEGWVQAKITKAADYVASVYHYLEYEMKFSEYGDHLANAEVYNESVNPALRAKLMEAKDKMKQLKKAQAEKMKESMVIGGGKEESCSECGGTGLVMSQGKVVPAHVHGKVEKYKRLTKATHAAHKRLDRNNNGIPDSLENDEVADEGFESDTAVGSKKKTPTGELTKTSTGVMHKNTSYADGADDDVAQRSGKGIKTHAKSQSASEKAAKAPKQKQSPKGAKTWGMKDSEKFDNRDGAEKPAKKEKEAEVDEALTSDAGPKNPYYEGKGKKPDFLDMDKDGDKKEPMKKAVADKKGGAPKKGVNPFAKKVDEALKGKQKNLDVDDDGDIEADDLADLRAGKKEKKVDEAGRTMSRAAKGHEKYGKEGMAALAKAGREGKDLDKVRNKYDKYDEATEPKDLPKKGEKVGKEGNAFGLAVTQTAKGDPIKVDGKDTGKIKKESIAESADFNQFTANLKRLIG